MAVLIGNSGGDAVR